MGYKWIYLVMERKSAIELKIDANIDLNNPSDRNALGGTVIDIVSDEIVPSN